MRCEILREFRFWVMFFFLLELRRGSNCLFGVGVKELGFCLLDRLL